MKEQKQSRGQSLLELAIFLPILVVLLFGIVEAGFGLRNYLIVSNANREGARLASRDLFSDQDVVVRVVGAGGIERRDGQDVPVLRMYGNQANTGVIITRLDFDDTGTVIGHTAWFSGVVPYDGEELPENYEDLFIGRPELPENVRWIGLRDSVDSPNSVDSRIDLTEVISRQGQSTVEINALRTSGGSGFEPVNNYVVIVETFYMHEPVGSGLVPSPWLMYAKTEMRVAISRTQTQPTATP